MAGDVKWIKITTDIFDDEKILLIESMPDSYAIITVWFKLLCLAGKQNNSGVFVMSNRIPYTDKMLATIFRMKESTVTMALNTFAEFGMIEVVDGVITIPNWNKHQSLDAYEKKKARDRIYQAERRAVQKLLVEQSSDKSSDKSSYVAFSDKEEDKEEDKEKDIVDKQKRKRFVPPTIDDVRAYCEERRNNVDARRFVDHYSANGWMVGKNKMKDWKAAVRNWERNEYSTPSKSENKTYDTKSRFAAAVERTRKNNTKVFEVEVKEA